MRDLAVLVPSRGRPASIARLWAAMQATCRGDTTLIVGLDDDDEGNYERIPGVKYEVRSGLRFLVVWLNELAVPAAEEYRFIGSLGDDFRPRTVGWDVRIMEALEKTAFAFGNDLAPREPGSLCTHVFCRSEIIGALGYFGPPVFSHMYVDAAWMEWGKAVGITYLHDVTIEHLHYTVGKSPVDATYAASAPLMGPDEVAFRAYCDDPAGLAADIDKIKAVLLWRYRPGI